MPDSQLLFFGLSFLVPLGYALIAAGGLPADRVRHAAVALLAALGLSAAGYMAAGFALQFGGIGLINERSGLEGLIWEWSALGPTWGPGWGMAGLVGWALTGPASTPEAYTLALANLPWVLTAVLIPVMALRGRAPAWAVALAGALVGAVVYPLAGNWIWGGGWLANLGSNLGLGHGLVDAGGAGLVHVLGAAVVLAGLLLFAPRKPRPARPDHALPVLHRPWAALAGAVLLLCGLPAWITANPLLAGTGLDAARITVNIILAAAAGALLPLAYTWLVAGRPDPLMAARGLAAGAVAATATAPFAPAWAALAAGATVGFIVPLVIYVIDRVLRWDDPAAALTVHGLGGALGLAALGLFADGQAGLGWNGIGAASYLGVAGQGVTGLLAAAGRQPDWPGQMQAQLVGGAALVLFGFFAAWLCLAPFAVLRYLVRPLPHRQDAPADASAAEEIAAIPEGGETPAEVVSEAAAPAGSMDAAPAPAGNAIPEEP